MEGMGRPRKSDTGLPRRMHWKNGAYRYLTSGRGGQGRRWIRLGTTWDEALAEYARLEAEASGATPTTVSGIIAHYRADVLPTLGKETQRGYRGRLNNLEAVFGHVGIEDVEPHHVARYLDEHPHKTAANRDKAVLSAVYSYALRRGLATRNPCREIRRHTERRRERYVTDEEFLAVRALAPEVLAVAMDLAYLTARRQGELLALRWSSVTDEGVQVQTSKGGRPVIIERSPALDAVLDRARALPANQVSSVYVICTQRGEPYTANGLRSAWVRARDKALKQELIREAYTFHDIRAKALTDYNERGEDAQALAGHRSRSTTEVYLRSKKLQKVQPLTSPGAAGKGE